jgi:hypothetical protein
MQHPPCSPDSKTCLKKKETEHATPAVYPRQHDMPQEEEKKQNMQHPPCSPDSKTCHKKKETEHATPAL